MANSSGCIIFLYLKFFLFKTIPTLQNILILLQLQMLFVKKSWCALARIELMPSRRDSVIQNTELQIQLIISIFYVKVSDLWKSNATFKIRNKVLVWARFQPDTYVICNWFALNTV
jgi:hypothetical protein